MKIMWNYLLQVKQWLTIKYHTIIAKLVYLPKSTRIIVGVIFMVFGAINMLNPFINGLIFLLGGTQVLLAKKATLQKIAKKHIKKTMTLLRKSAGFMREKVRRLSTLARTLKRKKKDEIKEVLKRRGKEEKG